MFPGVEIPQRPEPKDTKGTLEQLKESTVEGYRKIFDWFKNLFTKNKVESPTDPNKKGFLATMMGPFVGILNFIDSLGKKKEGNTETTTETNPETPAAPETAAQLEQLAQNINLTPLDHTKLKSEPYEMNKDQTITLCSGTGLKNLYKLGCRHIFKASEAVEDLKKDQNKKFDGLPSGDAYMVRNFYTMSRYHTKITGGLNAKENHKLVAPLDASGMRVADVLVDSRSDYNHRASAFKSSVDGHWYVLDPYRHDRSPDPIRIEEYQGNIEFVVPMKQDATPSLAYTPPKAQTQNT